MRRYRHPLTPCYKALALGRLGRGTMEAVRRWHQRNLVKHRVEVDHLLAIARSDGH